MLRPLALVLSVLVLCGGGAAAAAAAGPAPDASAPAVLINEIANGDADSDSNTFFELRNWGDEPVALDGWAVYRCSIQGLRRNDGQYEGELAGVVLAPGEIFTVSRVGLPGDDHVTSALPAAGTGLRLEDPEGRLVDAVGLYPNEPWPTESECTPPGGNLPNALDFAAGESWQRVAATGDARRDFVAAPSTLGAPNATRPPARSASAVVVSELAGAGPDGSDDDFVELVNAGPRVEELGGWRVFRCTAGGYLRPGTLQHVLPEGTSLAPGERLVLAGPGFRGEAAARSATGLGNTGFGVLVRDARGALVDRVAVSAHPDSPCQEGDAKLPAILDAVAAESWQRTPEGGWLVAPRTPGAPNATVEASVFREGFAYPAAPETPGVAISELATDPPAAGMPAGTERRNYVELGNYGPESVDIGGWELRRCRQDGTRAPEPQLVIPDGTVLAPGASYLAALRGTREAQGADAGYEVGLSFLGAGAWLADRAGERVDSVGVYARNELDAPNVTPSPCTKGHALTSYQPDRLERETFQRVGFTGVDADDFRTAPATPGRIDGLAPAPAAASSRGASVAAPAVGAAPAAGAAPVAPGRIAPWVASASPRSRPAAPAWTRARGAEPARVLEAWAGVSEEPLAAERGPGERRVDDALADPVTDSAWGLPYQRLVLDATGLGAGATVSWTGSTVGRNEVQLSAWDHEARRWRLLDAAAGPDLALAGRIRAGEIRDGRVAILVQDGPRTRATLGDTRDGLLAAPEDYDLAIAHLTDTQYLAESYPEVYAAMASWIAENAEERKIAFAAHTGDLVQNWVDPAQAPDRARREFERASAIQAILDDAGVPNSVLPGNHDNKRGVTNELFNEYFGPERYAGMPSYAGSIAPGDNRAGYSIVESAGARLLFLSLPYAYGEEELAWAEEVVAAHPDANVVVATHEHLTPKEQLAEARRATSKRWVSRADELWERVVAPNRNVVLVLAGHYHGLGTIVTEDAGGIPGHTVVELLADYQEFRTHTGERATGFERLLQLDLDGGRIAVDTFSVRLDASASHPYDYRQAAPDAGQEGSLSNDRPWRLVEAGLQERYTAEDDEFTVPVSLQFVKAVATDAVAVSAP